MAVTASSVRSRWSIPATIDDTLLAALITEATRKYRSATGEDGLSAYAAHLDGGSFAAWRRAFEGFSTYHVPPEDRPQALPAAPRLRLPLLSAGG